MSGHWFPSHVPCFVAHLFCAVRAQHGGIAGLEGLFHSMFGRITFKSFKSKNYAKNRTQLQPSKPKREITNLTNSQNTKRTYGQPSEQLFPKRWPLSNRNLTKNNMNTLKVKRHRKSDTKKKQAREPQQNY